VSQRSEQFENLLTTGAQRLLARASGSRALDLESVKVRIRAALDKYLFKDNENASDQSINEFIDSLQADDLCLILACERGEETAWSDLVERFTPTVRSAARSASANEESADDLAQSIWAELYGLRVRADGKPASKLAYYSGRGSLAGWLRAVVAQLAIDHHRKQSRLVQTEQDADFDRLSRDGDDGREQLVTSSTLNPESQIADKLAGVEMQDALTQSIGDLSAEDRLLIKLYYFDGLRLREAGAVLGVHEATASRRLTRIHAELRNRVEIILIRDRGWTKAETRRSFADVALHLEADLEPLLANSGNASNSEFVRS
jgi:RNA polymerase sigma-70 factor (ECF subfamily)